MCLICENVEAMSAKDDNRCPTYEFSEEFSLVKLLETFHKLFKGPTGSPALTDWLILQKKVLRDIK
jgi:hypothetical protein